MTDKPAGRSGEFALIERFFAPLAVALPGAFGLKDDAAALGPSEGMEFVLTTDTIVEGVHYRGSESPGSVAAKLLRVSLSDLAAKGARPLAYMLNLALPKTVDDAWLEAFAAGLAADQRTYEIALAGGDTVSTSGPTVLTLTAIGEAPVGRMLRRNAARPGDILFVSGTVGDGALGLLAADGRLPAAPGFDSSALVRRYEWPEPRVGLGPLLIGGAHAAMDVSDGLIGDLEHIAAASGVAADVHCAAAPLSDAAAAAVALDPTLMTVVLTGGDDYEILFTAPPEARSAVMRASDESGVKVSEIGEIREGEGVRVLDADGRPLDLPQTGYRHGR